MAQMAVTLKVGVHEWRVWIHAAELSSRMAEEAEGPEELSGTEAYLMSRVMAPVVAGTLLIGFISIRTLTLQRMLTFLPLMRDKVIHTISIPTISTYYIRKLVTTHSLLLFPDYYFTIIVLSTCCALPLAIDHLVGRI